MRIGPYHPSNNHHKDNYSEERYVPLSRSLALKSTVIPMPSWVMGSAT